MKQNPEDYLSKYYTDLELARKAINEQTSLLKIKEDKDTKKEAVLRDYVGITKDGYVYEGHGGKTYSVHVSKNYKPIKTVANYEIEKIYQLNFENEAMIKILLCMEKFTTEFGGFLIGTIDKEKEVIHIEEIFLPRQIVSSGECVFDNNDEAFVINKYQEKYLGIFHSHISMGAFYSYQDESVISESLKLKGTRFLSVVISESKTLVDRLTTSNMNKTDTLLSQMLETEFVANIFERTLEDKYVRHEINKVVVDSVDISEDELNLLKKEVDRFYNEVKDVVVERIPTTTEPDFNDNEIYELVYQFTDLIDMLYELETSKVGLIEAFVKVALDKDGCSDALDFFASVEEIKTCFVEYGYY